MAGSVLNTSLMRQTSLQFGEREELLPQMDEQMNK